METKNRYESIQHIKQCLQGDFPKLQHLIEKEQEESSKTSQKITDYLTSKVQKLNSALDD